MAQEPALTVGEMKQGRLIHPFLADVQLSTPSCMWNSHLLHAYLISGGAPPKFAQKVFFKEAHDSSLEFKKLNAQAKMLSFQISQSPVNYTVQTKIIDFNFSLIYLALDKIP